MVETLDNLPAIPPFRPQGDLTAWLRQVASGTHAGQPALLAHRIGHAIDMYWEQHHQDSPLAALETIKRAAVGIAEIDGLTGTTEAARLRAAIDHSVTLLRLLHGHYLAHLQRRFAGVFIIGSMSYGRFSSVRGTGDAGPSDLDLMLVAPDSSLELADLLLPQWVEDADNPERFTNYLRILENSPSDLLNYKLRNPGGDVGVSVTLCTLAGFANMTTLDGGPDRYVRLHWTAGLAGRPNPLPDLGGTIYNASYTETQSGAGNVLILPVVDYNVHLGQRFGRPNGLAAMLTPRFDHVIMTSEVECLLMGLVGGIQALADPYILAGKTPHICNVHPRRQRMSAYFCAHMQKTFEALAQRATLHKAGF